MITLLSTLFMILILVLPAAAQTVEAALALDHGAGVVTASWNSDETKILSASQNGNLRIWSADDGEILLALDQPETSFTHALWMDDGESILFADESGAVTYSSASDGETKYSWQLNGLPLSLEPNPDESLVLVFTDLGAGSVLSLEDGAVITDFARSGCVIGAGWSEDSSKLRAWSEDGRVVVWDARSGDEVATWSLPHRAMLQGLDWNGDDSEVLAWFTDGNVYVYRSDGAGVERRAISSARHRSFVRRAIWSKDESLVMSWAGDDTVHIWSASDGASRNVYRHEDWVVGARWDQAEARVLSWSHIYVYLWDGDAQPRRFRHDNLVRGATWNGDGTRILSWSWDGMARVWTP